MSNPEKRKRDRVKEIIVSVNPFKRTPKEEHTPKEEKGSAPEPGEPEPSAPSKDQESKAAEAEHSDGYGGFKPRGRPFATVKGPKPPPPPPPGGSKKGKSPDDQGNQEGEPGIN